jgi:2-dehydro-3-deoxyphosphogluconate aldolase/(4S)-4-hydroxy-2-oxoglutarate aldolase
LNKSIQIFEKLKTIPIVALLSPKDVEECLTAYEIFDPLKITLEITARTESAMDGIGAVLKRHPDALLLAGTVLLESQVHLLADLGIAGIVSPDYIPSVVDACLKNEIMCVPGGLYGVGTQLSHKASFLGCSVEELKDKYPYQYVHKLFPTYTETTSFIGLSRAWRGPFKDLRFFYTGGINSKTLEEAVTFDPEGIFGGSALTKSIHDPDQMKTVARTWISIVQNAAKP